MYKRYHKIGIHTTKEFFVSIPKAAEALGISYRYLHDYLNGRKKVIWLDNLVLYRVEEPICFKCYISLNDKNWRPSHSKHRHFICKSCTSIERKKWRKKNWLRRAAIRFNRTNNGNIGEWQLKDLILIQNNQCDICKTILDSSAHLDHIIPKSRGGKSVINNLQFLCKMCNVGKGNCTDEEYIEHCKKVSLLQSLSINI